MNLAAAPVYRTTDGSAPTVPPADLDIWVAQSSGTGTQSVTWPLERGDWTVVVMNADGSAGVTADLAVGATVPALDWLIPTLLITGGVGLALGIVLMVVALHGRSSAGEAVTTRG